MTNVVDFPSAETPEVIDEAYFEKYADAALLLKCFEVLKDALEVICEPEYTIEMEDDTHVALIEAFWAIKVLFKRKTGHDAVQVAKDHWEAMGRYLLEGAPRPEQLIPMVTAPMAPLPPSAFDGLTKQQMACAAYNYSERVREALLTNAPQALAMDEARVHSVDTATVLRKLVLALSGGSMESMAAQINRKHGETLQ